MLKDKTLMEKNVFIFDKNRCVGCEACVVACMNENPDQIPASWRTVYGRDTKHFPLLPLFYLSMACNHCDDAPCLQNCPAKAYTRDKITGAVEHHPDRCIGCKYCTWACPYDAPVFNPANGIIEKCTFCNSRLHEGLKPSCTTHCPVDALSFECKEFSREQALASSPVPVKVGSSIEIVELYKKEAPELDETLFSKNLPVASEPGEQSNNISAISEWPLLLFSMLSVAMIAMFVYAERAHDLRIAWLVPFTGLLAAGLSLKHTGRPSKAWRAILNIKHSWLSREIVSLMLFSGLVLVDLLLLDIPVAIILASGAVFLLSVDKVYSLAVWRWRFRIHSANTLLIALSLVLWLYGLFWWFAALNAIRIMLYLLREHKFRSELNFVGKSFRVLCPVSAFLILAFSGNYLLATCILIAGEVMDRIEFYNELRIPQPFDPE